MASKDALPTVKNEHVESQDLPDGVNDPPLTLELQGLESPSGTVEDALSRQGRHRQQPVMGDRGNNKAPDPPSHGALPEQMQGEVLATGGDREKTEAKSAKDREEHLHTFTFCHHSKSTANIISCKKAGTVLEALKTSPRFTTLVRKNKGKEIVIEKQKPVKADIATHFPCWLIKEAEEFTIKFRLGIQSEPEPPETATITKKRKLVTFYVDRKGGENCKKKKILKNMRKIVSYLCIYACEGETAKEALRRDGRFAEIVFQGGSELEYRKGGYSLEIDLPVTKQHNRKKFRLNMRKEENKSLQPVTETDSRSQIAGQAAGPAQEQGESTPSSARSAPANPPAQERGESTSRSAGSFHALPDSGDLLKILRSQFKHLVKHMKERENVRGNGEVLELLRQEFGKNTKEFLDVCSVRKCMDRSESVCHIINGSVKGTGFLLFDRFILTNAHLFENVNPHVRISFNYESEHSDKDSYLPVEVTALAYEPNDNKSLDYALLEIVEIDKSRTEKLPPALLTKFGPPIWWGGVCIIGHPDGGVKKVDFCSIVDHTQVKTEKTCLAIETDLFKWIRWNLSVEEKKRMIAYHTCFYHGASGSPVFDKNGDVFAMHTAGFSEPGTKSVVEYAAPLQSILEHFLRKMAEEKRLHILKRFIEVANGHKALRPLIAPYKQPDPEPMDTHPQQLPLAPPQ